MNINQYPLSLLLDASVNAFRKKNMMNYKALLRDKLVPYKITNPFYQLQNMTFEKNNPKNQGAYTYWG